MADSSMDIVSKVDRQEADKGAIDIANNGGDKNTLGLG
jgi:uncharacterized protein YajQ (UPF0234 family)